MHRRHRFSIKKDVVLAACRYPELQKRDPEIDEITPAL